MHPVYQELGKDSEKRCYAYRELFRQQLDDKQIDEIRDVINGQLVYGGEGFKEKCEKRFKRKTRRGKDRRLSSK